MHKAADAILGTVPFSNSNLLILLTMIIHGLYTILIHAIPTIPFHETMRHRNDKYVLGHCMLFPVCISRIKYKAVWLQSLHFYSLPYKVRKVTFINFINKELYMNCQLYICQSMS